MDSEDYRYAFAEDFLNTKLALQIHVLRNHRGLSQEHLAARIGTKQEGVSRIENANYSGWSVQTLKKVARALGVRLSVSFESFGTLLDEAETLSPESLIVPSFEDDPGFRHVSSQDVQDFHADATSEGGQMQDYAYSPTMDTVPFDATVVGKIRDHAS